MEVAIIGPDGGDAIALGPIQMRILEDGSTTNRRLGVGEITLQPHTDGPPQHRHHLAGLDGEPHPVQQPSLRAPAPRSPSALRRPSLRRIDRMRA